MADAVRGVEHAAEGALNVPECDISPLCDEVVDQPFLFASGQIEDIGGETLFYLGHRPGQDLR